VERCPGNAGRGRFVLRRSGGSRWCGISCGVVAAPLNGGVVLRRRRGASCFAESAVGRSDCLTEDGGRLGCGQRTVGRLDGGRSDGRVELLRQVLTQSPKADRINAAKRARNLRIGEGSQKSQANQ
jgi:hypothetical protein